MRVGIILNAGDPRTLADLAAEAEAAGWDGVFYYDAIAIGSGELYDPWLSSRRWRCARSVSGSGSSSRRRPAGGHGSSVARR